MAYNLVVPEVNSKPKNTKDAVINILTYEWPLTLRAIFYKIKKQFAHPASYQAVYKAVKELTESKVLSKNNLLYEINIEWVKELQSFTDTVETNYYAKKKMENVLGLKDSRKNDNLMVLTFETIFDAEKYLYYLIKREMLKRKNDLLCYQTKHEWRPLFYLRSEYNYYRKLKKNGHKFYFVCSGSSHLEKLFETFYKSIGVNYKLVEAPLTNDIITFGEYYIQIFIPEELTAKLSASLKNKKILQFITEVMEKKSEIKLVINLDASLAEQVKKQITKQFSTQ